MYNQPRRPTIGIPDPNTAPLPPFPTTYPPHDAYGHSHYPPSSASSVSQSGATPYNISPSSQGSSQYSGYFRDQYYPQETNTSFYTASTITDTYGGNAAYASPPPPPPHYQPQHRPVPRTSSVPLMPHPEHHNLARYRSAPDVRHPADYYPHSTAPSTDNWSESHHSVESEYYSPYPSPHPGAYPPPGPAYPSPSSVSHSSPSAYPSPTGNYGSRNPSPVPSPNYYPPAAYPRTTPAQLTNMAEGRPPMSPYSAAGPLPPSGRRPGPPLARSNSSVGSGSVSSGAPSRQVRELKPEDSSLDEALQRSLNDAEHERRLRAEKEKKMEEADEVALMRALEQSTLETRAPRSIAEDADDEALRRALAESVLEANAPRPKTAQEIADEEALQRALELSMKEASTGVYHSKPFQQSPNAGIRVVQYQVPASRSMQPNYR